MSWEAANDSGERLRRLQPVIDTGLVQLAFEDLLAELLKRSREILKADTAVVLGAPQPRSPRRTVAIGPPVAG
jgi:hypothetical protein